LSSNIGDISIDLNKLPELLERYENELIDAEEHLKIKGKNLEQANIEQAAWQSYYDQRRIELHTLVKYFDARVQKTRGRLYKNYTEVHSHVLSDRMKDKYVDNEDAFLTMYEMYLEVKELDDKYTAIVDAFRSRGFALRNIVQLRVAALEDVHL
jgi:hypothetical protein